MNSVFGSFSRRTFLGSASFAAAYVATPHLKRPPLPAEILVDDERDLATLCLVCGSATLRADLVTVRTVAALPQVAASLSKAGHPQVTVSSLDTRPNYTKPGSGVKLILGRWTGAEGHLAAILQTESPMYCDDPTLAFRLKTYAGRHRFPDRSLVGLDAALDPLVDLAGQRMHVGQIGGLTGFSAMIPQRNGILALEAAFIAGRIDPSRKTPLMLIETRNAHPIFHLTTTGGSLQIPLFSALERSGALQDRLQHFESVAREEDVSRISIQDIVRKSSHLQSLL